MTAITALLDYVMPDVPQCPTALAMDKIRLAAREFFSRSGVWNQIYPGINVVAGTRRYAIPVDAALEADATGLMEVWYNNRRIFIRSIAQLNLMYQNFDTQTGEPYYWNMYTQNNVDLYPLPSRALAGGLKVWAVLAPKIDASQIQDEHFIQWRDKIAHGAKRMIMEIPKKPYSDPGGAGYHRIEFDRGVAEASAWVQAGNGRFSGGEIRMVLE